ncbi:hypothetical protein, partial [Morganella morganii]|uniref:hypothetical protein n=1 Tax=Morganella morganii TaxID=582 RepID=UPI00195362C5
QDLSSIALAMGSVGKPIELLNKKGEFLQDVQGADQRENIFSRMKRNSEEEKIITNLIDTLE